MKKKTAITVSALLLLTVGGVSALKRHQSKAGERTTIFATARDKQLAWLKEHEEQIVALGPLLDIRK